MSFIDMSCPQSKTSAKRYLSAVLRAGVLAFLFCAGVLPASGPPRSSEATTDAKVNTLLARMTLEAKLGQLQQLDGHANGDYRPEHVDLARQGLLGSTLNVRGAGRVNALQRVAMEESRLGIPLLFAFDVIHGYRTIFPVPLALAAAWDPSVAEEAASIAAAEATAAGIKWTFAPMVDIARDARWGRIVEGSGEDPFLGAMLAHAQVRGFQGDDYSAPTKLLACAKHWAGYGAAEGGRDYNSTEIAEHTLREVYLPPFKAALGAGVGTFMSAFNDLNGVPASANSFLLTRILRDEWKFSGFVVSDYEAVKELVNHGFATDEIEAAGAAFSAGVDMEMVTRLYRQHLPRLLKEGKISLAMIDEAVRRVLRVKYRLGLFERPYTDESREAAVLLSRDHLAAARRAAAHSMVLLKNDDRVLPLARDLNSLAVIGPLADDPQAPLGSWTGDGRKEDVVTLLAGVKAQVSPQTRVVYAKGCDIGGACPDDFDEAVRVARGADAVILSVGETAEMSGEAASRSSVDLPGNQLELVKAVQATGKPVVVVLMNGRPLAIPWLAENVSAILETWFAGTQAGHAIADVLFGAVNPGGKLPVTFPYNTGQIPIYYNHKNTGRPPAAGHKYTSKYLDAPWTPLYPFGYGLSYTRFRLADLQLSSRHIPPEGRLTVSVAVKNVGLRAGDEVVQLYLRDVAASVTRPVKELKGFQRITLQPGEKQRVTFVLGPEHLAFYNREMRFVVEPGRFLVMVGTSSADVIESSFEVLAK
ncbi:MAG: beta-glucosidase BglX [Acidobacteriota bacterium]